MAAMGKNTKRETKQIVESNSFPSPKNNHKKIIKEDEIDAGIDRIFQVVIQPAQRTTIGSARVADTSHRESRCSEGEPYPLNFYKSHPTTVSKNV